jgi:hypothetical protein
MDDTNPSSYDAEIQEAIDKATHACQMASGNVPEPLHWGAWIYSDAHPAMGGGVGGFVWFESRDEMLAFLHAHLAFLDPSIDGRADAFDLHNACKSVVDAARSDSLPLRVAITRLNHLVRGLSVIKWWGRMEDLLTGEEAFPCEMRCRFRQAPKEGIYDAPPIDEADEEDFMNFLRTID